MLGVVDGLGHGPAAAAAARQAVQVLAENADSDPTAALRLCHERLRASRGVVLTLAWLDAPRACMTWLGVGNVQAVLVRGAGEAGPQQENLVGRAGVVGRQLPPLHPGTVAIAPGDLLVLATDGIHPGFARAIPRLDSAQRAADEILARHRTGVDDGLVLVARYRGGPA